ncbi:MAG: hypothetical protein GKR98_13660 [Boseongicola sp.]|nr:MAG: hypothetical protein GKR98_13660 [Boseongicola sp.]
MFWLLVVASVLLIHVGGAPASEDGQALMPPFVFVLMSGAAGTASVFAIWKIGQLMGGSGSFQETLLLTIFLQAIIFAGQMIELVIFVVFPSLAGLFSVLLILVAFWMNLNFIAALHGFASLWKALGVFVLASFVVLLVLMTVTSLAGLRVEGAA